jgi:hypothetical protein
VPLLAPLLDGGCPPFDDQPPLDDQPWFEPQPFELEP